MCGIAGLVTEKENSALLRKMAACMAKRGPDGEGFFERRVPGTDHYAGLAHRRLSIIDLATGDQPMANEKNDVFVVLNGEIFNHAKLRRELEAKGHVFRTRGSDTEALVHLWEEFGEEMLSHLDGMFAFCVLDFRNNTLFLARDRMGIKPLYYSYTSKGLSFGSTATAVLAAGASRALNPDSLRHFFTFQCSPAPDSIFAGVKKLPPGHSLRMSMVDWSLRISQYWALKFPSQTAPRTTENTTEELRHQMQNAIERWAMSDVPVATSLSGGLDSSIVTATLAQTMGSGFHAYTLRATDAKPAEDETELARALAKKYSLRHTVVEVGPGQVLGTLDRMVESLDEPYAGGLPSWFIYEAMRKDGYKVCMTGVGGDELFGNYGKWLPFERTNPLALFRLLKLYRRQPAKFLALCAQTGVADRLPLYLRRRDKNEILVPEWAADGGASSEALLEKLWQALGSMHPRNKIAAADFQIQLPEEFLYVSDRFSMAHSVEARTPFLDHHLVESVFSLPPEMRSPTQDPKALLKEIGAGLLPAEILGAGKRGFTLPVERWLKHELRGLFHDLTEENYLAAQGIFRKNMRPTLRGWLDSGDLTKVYRVWTVLLFQLWHRKTMGLNL